MPGSSPTIARREPIRRLKSVDLPTFGRPTIASTGTRVFVFSATTDNLSSLTRASRQLETRVDARLYQSQLLFTSYYKKTAVMASPSHPETAAQPRRLPTLQQFFAPGGLLSQAHPNYEFRRGQLEMAQSVEKALEERRHLIVEAGTGTGKTLAYLVPVIRSGKRVIISTGTKNLQEQLFYKDIPFLEHALFPDGEGKLSVCYMKGRNNYLCRKKLYDLTDQPVLGGLDEIGQYRAIAAWEKTTQTGDRAELAELPEASLLWHKLDARSDACIGQKCSQWERRSEEHTSEL